MSMGNAAVAVLAVVCLALGFVSGMMMEVGFEFGDDDDDEGGFSSPALLDGPYAPDIEADDFVSGVDHPFFPLTPGLRNVYEGQTEDGLPVELHVLRSDRMSVVPGADGWPRAYDYSVGGKTHRFAADVICHIKAFHP